MNEVSKRIMAVANESARKRNPEIFGSASAPMVTAASLLEKQPKRLRQSAKPLMNKLETEWFNVIKDAHPNYPPVRCQSKTYRLANGVRYTPDFTASSWPANALYGMAVGAASGPDLETAWEVKGKHAWDDSLVKLKIMASTFPEVRVILVWKDAHKKWQQQIVLP